MIGLKEKSPCVSSIIVYKGENLIPPKGWGGGEDGYEGGREGSKERGGVKTFRMEGG